MTVEINPSLELRKSHLYLKFKDPSTLFNFIDLCDSLGVNIRGLDEISCAIGIDFMDFFYYRRKSMGFSLLCREIESYSEIDDLGNKEEYSLILNPEYDYGYMGVDNYKKRFMINLYLGTFTDTSNNNISDINIITSLLGMFDIITTTEENSIEHMLAMVLFRRGYFTDVRTRFYLPSISGRLRRALDFLGISTGQVEPIYEVIENYYRYEL